MKIPNWRLAASLAVLSASALAAAPQELNVYTDRPLESGHVTVANFETSMRLDGDTAVIPPSVAIPSNRVVASKTGKGLTLSFKDSWYASLRVDGDKPVDLRPYLARGVLALDVDVKEMSNGGLSFALGCGDKCSRNVSYVIPARAIAGKGWQHVVFPVSCFVHDGDDLSAITRPFVLDATGTGEVSVADIRYQASGKPNASCPDYKTVSVTPDKLNESWAIDWWTPRHEKKLAEARALGKSAQVVFIGDSITEGWEKSGAPVWERYYKPMNGLALGFGGDRTENVLWRLLHGEVDGIAPKVAVLMFGTNNTGHRHEDPKTTAIGIQRNIDELRRRLPDTRILLLAIFPRGATPDDELRRINEQVNGIISGFADNQHVFFLNINKEFLAPDGTLSKDIMPDLLHPNEKGYEIWARSMAPELKRLMGGGESYAWGNVAIGGSGFVSGIITSKTEKGLVYARTDVGGAYRWDGANQRWIPLLDWVSDQETGLLGVESIAIDPSAPAKVYLSTGIAYMNGGASAILKSSDYGKTFTKIDVTGQFKVHGNGMGRGNGEKLQVDPVNGKILYVGTRANGMFKSVDEGLTWRHLDSLQVDTTPNRNGVSFVVLDPASAGGKANEKGGETSRIFAGVSRYGSVGANMYMSNDAGKTFTALAGGPAALMPQRAVLAKGSLVVVYAQGAGPWGDKAHGEGMEQGAVWKYDIAAARWSNISPPLNRAYAGITVDPGNPDRMIVSTISYYGQPHTMGDKFFETLDGGKSWHSIVGQGVKIDANGVSWIAGSFIHWTASIEFDPFDTNTAMVVSGNGIFKSTDIHAAPAVWKFEGAGLEESVPLNMVSIPGGPAISAIGDYDGFRHTDVTQYGPIHTPTMGTTWGLDYAAGDPRVVARVGSEMYLSGDMGVSWKKTASLKGRQGQLALSADGKVIVHSPAKSTVSYYSADAGDSWIAVKGLDGGRPVADPVNPRKFYALSGANMLVSKDGGASFAPAGGLASAKGSKVVRAAPGREGDVWVALYDGGLARSTDSGASFANLGNVGYAAAVGFGKAAPGAGYPAVYIWGSVGGVRGLFRSTDTGASWQRINDDEHQYGGPGDAQFVIGDSNTYGVVYMSTAGRGIVYGRPTSDAREKTFAISKSI
jgi:lysophospholipase L1-like esterase